MKNLREVCGGVSAGTPPQACKARAVEVVGLVPVCQRHRRQLQEALGGQPYAVPTAIVYFLLDRDTRQVKIGSTTRMLSRFNGIQRQRPEIELVAVEPGYLDQERTRHRQFARSRVTHHGGNREWYHRTQELVDLINELRQLHGDPWQHPAVRNVPR